MKPVVRWIIRLALVGLMPLILAQTLGPIYWIVEAGMTEYWIIQVRQFETISC